MAAQRPLTRRKRTGLGIGAGVLALGIIGSFGDHPTDTAPASDSRAAATSTAAPTTHPQQALRAVTPPTTSSPVVTTAPPKPLMTMTCPAGGADSSPEFGQQIVATAPFTVVIDYGDGDRYSNDDQHLGAVFSHTYSAGGSFTVTAALTDATGQTASATCTYTWTKPAPAPVVRSSSGGSGVSSGGSGASSGGFSGGSSSSSGGSSGDTYTNVDGNEVHSPVEAPSAPAGASAHCEDGTWSFSQHRQGTCSGHGGVGQWL